MSGSEFLFKVAEVFQLTGRLVVVADILREDLENRSWRHGSLVELRRPDGSRVRTKTWSEMMWPSNSGRPIAFSVENSLSKDDIPTGSEVWLMTWKVESSEVEDRD